MVRDMREGREEEKKRGGEETRENFNKKRLQKNKFFMIFSFK